MAVAVLDPEPAVPTRFGMPSPIGSDCRVSVVVPALNEAENLPHVLPRIPAWVHEVLLVDGGSHDGTADMARRLRPTVRLIDQEGRGKGAALRSGFAAATGDIVVMLDADGSTDPAEIPAFVGALLAGADFAKGTRFIQGGGTADMPWLRRLGNWLFVTMANLMFRVRFSDITYGYNAIWRRHHSVLAREINGWAQEIISNIRLTQAGLRVVLFTSPHLVAFGERIQVNRQPISENDVSRLVVHLQDLLRTFSAEEHPTFFEVVTVMALCYFAEQKYDVVIWETGLGGRLDATNIVSPIAAGFSPRSDCWMAFSIAVSAALSKGCTTRSRGSGAESVASWMSGVLAP